MRWNSRWSQERRTWRVPKIWPPNHWREGLVAAAETAFLSCQGASIETWEREKNALWITGIVLFPCQAREDAKNAPPEAWFWRLKCKTCGASKTGFHWTGWISWTVNAPGCSTQEEGERQIKRRRQQNSETAFVKCSSSRCKWNSSAWWIFVNPHDAGIPPNARGSHFERLTSFRHCNLIQFHLSAKYSTNVSKGFVKSGSHGYDFCFLMVMLFSVKVLC